MSPRGTIDLGDGPVPGTWSLADDDSAGPLLLLSPEGLPPASVDLRETSGITGDGYSLELQAGERAIRLTKLGADGPTLREALWRLWPPLRAKTLRLDAAGEQTLFAGSIDLGDGAPGGHGLIVVLGHALLAAVEGGDLKPVFLSDISSIRPVDDGYALELTGWDGARLVFSRLAAKTEAFTQTVTEKRARLTAEASDVLAANLPAVGPADRARVAARWLPGQVLSLAELEALTPGFAAQLETGWLARSPRAAEARALAAAHRRDAVFIGYTRPGAEVSPVGEMPPAGEEPPPAGSTSAEADAAGLLRDLPAEQPSAGPLDQPSVDAGGPHLWLLVDRGAERSPRWALENVSTGDFATYRFTGGSELPRLIGHLLGAPQFSREALYLPLTDLTGDRADLAVPARDLAFLRELRARFAGRVIHGDLERWLTALEA